MYVPIQQTFYGPKATLNKVSDDYLMLIQDPISMQLKWRQTPRNVFVIKKECDSVFESFNEFVNYLTNVSLGCCFILIEIIDLIEMKLIHFILIPETQPSSLH